MIEFEHKCSEQEYLTIVHEYLNAALWFKVLRVILLIAFFSLITLYATVVHSWWLLAPAIITGLFAVHFFVTYRIEARWIARKAARTKLQYTYRYKISEAGIDRATEIGSNTFNWNEVRGWGLVGEYYFLYFGQGRMPLSRRLMTPAQQAQLEDYLAGAGVARR